MEKTTSAEALKELTLMLMYLTRFHDMDRFANPGPLHAWKGYPFDALNELADLDYIRQGEHPSRSKKVLLTPAGLEAAQKLLAKYGIEEVSQQ